MNSELNNLRELQKVDREILRLQQEIASLPRRVAVIEEKLADARNRGDSPGLFTLAQYELANKLVLSKLKPALGVSAEDVAKRLMDYGFHAPTLSFPIPDTLMVEPTESESKRELDRFCDAMIAIHGELEKLRRGEWDRADNPLRNAPHTAVELAGEWRHPYSREAAAFPVPGLRAAKFWPAVKRVDAAFGDRNLVCACPPLEAYA